jgi:hypothetical protein
MDIDDEQGLLKARLAGGEWEYLTPFKPSLEPDYRLLNCGELKAELNARFGLPTQSGEGTGVLKPRGTKDRRLTTDDACLGSSSYVAYCW